MSRRICAFLLLVAALATGATACGDDGNGADDEPSLTSEEPTEGPPPATTGAGASGDTSGAGGPTEEAARAAFERAYSECASTRMQLLTQKYSKGKRDDVEIARRAGHAWARQFRHTGVSEVVEAGRDGCSRALERR